MRKQISCKHLHKKGEQRNVREKKISCKHLHKKDKHRNVKKKKSVAQIFHKKADTQKCEKNQLQMFTEKKTNRGILGRINQSHRFAQKRWNTEMQKNQLPACQLRVRDLFAQILPKLQLLLHIFHCRGISCSAFKVTPVGNWLSCASSLFWWKTQRIYT